MEYLRETGDTLCAFDEACMGERIFEYSVKNEDYFLRFFVMWETVDATIYSFSVGEETFNIPSGFYVLCFSGDSVFDWVLSDELIDRSIPFFILNKDLVSRFPKEPELKKTYTSNIYYPSTNEPLPVGSESKNSFVLVSRVDMYHKTKDMDISAFSVG